MRGNPRVVVMGIVGGTPFAGVALQALHYLEGFRRSGCEVYYIEDSGNWPYDPDQNAITEDCTYAVQFVKATMERAGFSGHWAYRNRWDRDGRINSFLGLTDREVKDIFRNSDILANVTGTTRLAEEHMTVPTRIYLESDPVFQQVLVAKNDSRTIDLLEAHTHYFTFGENIGKDDCTIPTDPFHYHHTRQPVVLDWWSSNDCRVSDPDSGNTFTTISSWQQSGKDIEWEGETYLWSKHLEFLKFIDLPRHTDQSLELALACEDPEVIQLLTSHGWGVIDAVALSTNIHPYTKYITSSRGEFTVAKDQYVRPRSGWFSDRSACYLAAGRPVITQNTGFDCVLPVGEGLFSFNKLEDILAAFQAINSDYDRHCRAALEIAHEYFEAEKVVGEILRRI